MEVNTKDITWIGMMKSQTTYFVYFDPKTHSYNKKEAVQQCIYKIKFLSSMPQASLVHRA